MSTTGADTKEEDEKTEADTPVNSATNTMDYNEKDDVKMAGYLEKRGKMKLLSTWKRYWFVLEGRLLLYYRSQLEYLNLSACRGSLNMGIAKCVRPIPGPGFIMEVVTRTQVITLRTKERAVQEQWLQALLDSMALPNISSPVRGNGGPLHFRYSMDNLPTVDEMEQLDSRDKQGTLPRQPKPTSVSRRESVLMRIKHLGGRSYGGSLDTVLKRETGNQMQQPKIPRIKAVDRMLGLQVKNGDQSTLDTKDLQTSTILSNTDEGEIKSDTSNNTILSVRDEGEIRSETSSILSESESIKQESSTRVENVQDNLQKPESSPVEGNEGEVHSTKHSCSVIQDSLSKSHDDNEVDSFSDEATAQLESHRTPQYAEVENQLYIKTPMEHNKENLPEFSEELPVHSKIQETENTTTNDNEEMYEAVEGKGDYLTNEEEYYSNYDQMSVIQDCNNGYIPIPEPTLPPRPSVSNPESPDEVGYVDYDAYYEPEAQTESLSLRSEKKKKPKLKLRVMKSSTKDYVTAENVATTKKRKLSFIRKMLKHYRRKPEHPVQDAKEEVGEYKQDEELEEEEPVYDTVNYSSAVPNTSELLATEDTRTVEPKDKVFGTATLLPATAMHELRLKLKKREDETRKEVTETNPGSSYDDGEKIPPSNLQSREATADADCNDLDSMNDADSAERPQLPPRRARRPSSPWHDIPTNNSPIYGNFNFQPVNTADEDGVNQDIPDEMLGTPQGYTYIQNKWKAAERSGEWHRELRQVAFPTNTRNQGPKILQTSDDSTSHSHDNLKTCVKEDNVKTSQTNSDSVELYSKINKKADGDKDKLTVISDIVCSYKYCVKELRNRVNEECVVENVNYMPFTSDKLSEALNDETSDFQKDSLMNSICAQADSELDVSTPYVCPNICNQTENRSDQDNVRLQVMYRCASEIKSVHETLPALKKNGENEIVSQEQSEITTKLHTNRHSDELNQLLAQLAEISSAPLHCPGATKSLTDFPESKVPHLQELTLSDRITLLGPIRRRRHSEPDYDIPRPHNSLMHIKMSRHFIHESTERKESFSESKQLTESTLPGELTESSSLSRDSEQAQLSWTLSMAPDSLEPIPMKYQDASFKQDS